MGFYLRSHLGPSPLPVPFSSIVLRWLEAKMEPQACRRAVEDALRDGMPEGLLDPDQVTSGGVVGTPALIAGCGDKGMWRWTFGTPQGPRSLEFPAEYAATLAELARVAARAQRLEEVVAYAGEYVDDEEFLALLKVCLVNSSEWGKWPAAERPGIYRREHASLRFRSSGGTSLVTDPKRCARDWTTNFDRFPGEDNWEPADVLITHSHEDHFDLTSIASYADSDQRVFVPVVPRPSLLAPDMQAILEQVDQPAVASPWWSRFTVGDVGIDVLPFYGEQPTRRLPMAEGLRNWGNTYRVRIDGLSVVILADSGADPSGDAVEALERSAREEGPIDVVMSCCIPFQEMLNPGLPHYAFTIPFEVLCTQYATGFSSITNGPSGLARACRAAGARYFLPYAHGFMALGRDPVSDASHEASVSEVEIMTSVRREFERERSTTQILDWSPGDSLHWHDGEISMTRIERA